MSKKTLLMSALAVSLISIPALGIGDCLNPILNSQGKAIGHISLKETPHGVLIQAHAQDLPEGWHGFHVHQVGKCEAPGFQSAGGHFNPTNEAHGFESPQGHHLGDIPNVYIGKDSLLQTEVLVPGVTLKAGPNSLLDQDGSALVIHQGPDDYKTDPAGASGDRIACAVIK